MRAGIIVVIAGLVMWSMALDAFGGDDGAEATASSTPTAREAGGTVGNTPAADGPVAAPELGDADAVDDGGPSTALTATATPTSPTETESEGRVHVVERGDTMARIAQRYGLPLGALIVANPQIEDPARIEIGDRINIPE